MSGMKYRWERLLADKECKAALEKILGCKPGEADTDELNELTCCGYDDLKGAQTLFYTDYEGGGCYGGYWAVFTWRGRYFFYDGFFDAHDYDDAGPFDDIESAFACASFPMGDEYDQYVNVSVSSSLPVDEVLSRSVAFVKNKYRILVNGKNYLRQGDQLKEMKRAKPGAIQNGLACVGVIKKKAGETTTTLLPWVEEAISQIGELKKFEDITGHCFSNFKWDGGAKGFPFGYKDLDVEAYLGLLMVEHKFTTNYWATDLDGGPELKEWQRFYLHALSCIKSRIPASADAGLVAAAGNDPVKLADLLVDQGTFKRREPKK